MNESAGGTTPKREWTFYRFGLLVTGRGEEVFLPSFFRSLTMEVDCTFHVIRRISQRSPVTSQKRKLRMVGSGKAIPDRDATEIGLPARNYLNCHPDSFVLLVDDLEFDRRDRHIEVFDRYRSALDKLLPEEARHRTSVHFFVNMIEAYYFADTNAINGALATKLSDFNGDVEAIVHPKKQLKLAQPSFDELANGCKIVRRLDLEKVLGNPETCASLRTLFKWCWLARRGDLSDRFQLRNGICSPITEPQVESLSLAIGVATAGE